MKEGDTVYWDTVNGIRRGVLKKLQEDGDWLVLLDNGKYVLVNESSFKDAT